MASGKKGKKTKGKTLALTDFLQETTGSVPTQPIRKSTTSWADEVDEYDASDHKIINVALPTAPKASRDYDDITNKVPKEPPFMAYLSNLPYDVDEDEIAEFFKNMRIANMRIPKDERPGEAPKLKGFGYVEFEDRESLMSALIIPDTNLKNRRIRIEVATNADNDRRGGRSGNRMMDRMDTGGDWRSTNRPEPVEERRGFGRDRDRDRDGGSSGGFTREGMREGGSTGGRDYGGFNRDREGGGFNRDREGGGFNRDREGGGFNRDYGRNRDRDEGFNRNRDEGFNRNREQDDRPGAWRDGERERSNNYNDRGYSRGYNRDDREDRRGGGGGFRRHDDSERNGGFSRSSNRGDKDDREDNSEGRQRPKLNLAPRTKPIETTKPESTAPSASIFGNAKPVDTAERERQIEEKLLREQEERLTDSKDRDGDEGERRGGDRSRAARREDKGEGNKDKEVTSRERGPPSRDRGHDSGDEKKKQDKPKREEKKDKPDKELPKLLEPETPNFQGSNKFALLEDGDE